MAIEFNPENGKFPAKKAVKSQGAPKKPDIDIASKISKNAEFEDPMDAMQKLMDGETDIKTALGFIKSAPVPPEEKEVTSEELFEDLMSGKIDHNEYTEALKSLPEGIPDDGE